MNYRLKEKIKTASFLFLGGAAIVGIIGINLHYMSDDSSKEFLIENGFKDPIITGFKFTCTKGTLRRFEFHAIDKNGDEVDGYVCATRLFLDDNITIENRKPKM